MDFQVIILAGGTSEKLSPIVSEDAPKALLPVANRPVLSYVLELLEASNLKDLLVVVEGEDAAVKVGGWISSAFADRLHVEVAAVPEDIGTAGALRAVTHHLTSSDVLIVSGDIVSDVSPGALAATHRRHGAVVTALLCPLPVSGPSDAGSSGGKDKAKKPSRCNIVGLDPTRQFLLHIASGAEVEKDVRVQKSILWAVGQMEIRADLMDAHMYAFKRTVLQDVLDQKDNFHSIRQDVLPYLVRTQLRSEVSASEMPIADEAGNGLDPSHRNLRWLSKHREVAPTAFQDLYVSGHGTKLESPRTHKCCAYISSKSKYCARLNSIQAFCDINRDVVGEASHLSGYSFSVQNNIIHSSAVLGSKTTQVTELCIVSVKKKKHWMDPQLVGPQCMLAEGSQLGDKCSVKRSVIGRHCRIGSNVKIVNSVVMNHVTIEDGCFVQGSVICSNVQLQERAVLKDCQVGAGYVITSGSEHKTESLSKK